MKDPRLCDVVQDLLPTYIEGLTSEGSSSLIREHLDTCEDCSRVYRRMTEPGPEETADKLAEAPEIDYLRKTKMKTRHLLLTVVALAAAALAAVLVVIFCRRQVLTPDAFVARATVVDNADGELVQIEGTVMTDYRYRGCRFTDAGDGVIKVDIEASRDIIFGQDRQFMAGFGPVENVRQVWIGDTLAWEDEEQIPVFISDLFKAKIPYVGDNVGVSRLVETLGVGSTLGAFTLGLQTAEEPYGMIVHLSEPLDGTRVEAAEEQMRSYSCVLLALIDNLGEASFEYYLDDASDEGHLVTVTANEATLLSGADIKKAAATAADLSRLMRQLGLVDNYVSTGYIYADLAGIRLDMIVDTDGTFDEADLSVLLENEVISSMGTIHADETPWTPGEVINFDVTYMHFGQAGGISDGQTFTVRIDLTKDGRTYSTEPLELVYRDGTVYETVLTGSAEAGFALSAR